MTQRNLSEQQNLFFEVTDNSKCLFLPDPSFNEAESRRGSNLATAVVNGIFSPTAVLSNFLILFVIYRTPSLRRPSNIFIACLAFSDLLVGMIVQPSYVAYRLGENRYQFVSCIVRMVYSFGFYICYGISFMTLSAVSCDRYIALRLHLRYNEVVTPTRVFKLIGFIWFLDITLALLQFAGMIDKRYNTIVRATQLVLWLLCLVTTTVANYKTLKIVQHHRKDIAYMQKISSQDKAKGAFQNQIKIAISVSYIVGFYLVFNMPVLFVTVYHQVVKKEMCYNIYSWTETIAFLNSSVNPIICCWKRYEIRRRVFSLFQHFKCRKKLVNLERKEDIILANICKKSCHLDVLRNSGNRVGRAMLYEGSTESSILGGTMLLRNNNIN